MVKNSIEICGCISTNEFFSHFLPHTLTAAFTSSLMTWIIGKDRSDVCLFVYLWPLNESKVRVDERCYPPHKKVRKFANLENLQLYNGIRNLFSSYINVEQGVQ